MKVLGIFGSPRKDGNTDILLEEFLKGAEKEGAEIERLHLINYSITPCKECHGCDNTGVCVIEDDMQKIYPKILEADIIVFASPVFFYGVSGWAKAFVDRFQAFWAKKYLLKDPSLSKSGKKRKGFLISVGATKGERVFEGVILTTKYFFDVINAEYKGELVFRSVEQKGDILKYQDALRQAFEAGRRLTLDC